VAARASVASHLTPERPEVSERLARMVASIAARGVDELTARTTALRALAGLVGRQAALIAFDHLFLLAGILFLAVLPLLPFLRSPEAARIAPRPLAEME
jgi:MFS transporter, DHA2 family, multidrug resistance protein